MLRVVQIHRVDGTINLYRKDGKFFGWNGDGETFRIWFHRGEVHAEHLTNGTLLCARTVKAMDEALRSNHPKRDQGIAA